jgi:thioredoxin 1
VIKHLHMKSLLLGLCLLLTASSCLAEQLPRLVDVGADKCIPCKLMAPILDELEKDFVGQMEVLFVDAWKNPDAAESYGVRLIPTQIFYGAEGKELYRHQGFFGREDILATWQKFGYEFGPVK